MSTLDYPKSAAIESFPKDSRTSLKEPSVFEPLKFYCINIYDYITACIMIFLYIFECCISVAYF